MGEPHGDVLLSCEEVADRVDRLAQALFQAIDEETVLVCLMTGAMWFAADLTRALYRLGRDPLFDCLWLSSYGDGRESGGVVAVRAGLQRPVCGRRVVIADDVVDSGLSLEQARRIVLDAGAKDVLTAVFARKPWPSLRACEPDYVAWEAPARFLCGYGMDVAGRRRGLPGVAALD